uniref:Uncharacterized protein n=1 Tax=Lepeophtheirus salmonis TaxID=72036 RepID=A0A0K2U673_LEPSM
MPSHLYESAKIVRSKASLSSTWILKENKLDRACLPDWIYECFDSIDIS